MFGQFGHFYKYAKEKIPYGIERYANEAKRLIGVLERQLEGKEVTHAISRASCS